MGAGSSTGQSRSGSTSLNQNPQHYYHHNHFGGNHRVVSQSQSFSEPSPPRYSQSGVSGRSSSISISSILSGGSSRGTVKEHRRFGTVSVKIVANPPAITVANGRNNSNLIHHTVTPRGAVLYGSLCSPCIIQKALQSTGFPMLPPAEITLADTRAHRLLIAHCPSEANNQAGGWYAIPFPETFSRHSGSCLILGDRNVVSNPLVIKTGDCFRLGSVGLVVSEMRLGGEGCEETQIDSRALQFLKDESIAFETQEFMAALATDEKERETELFNRGESQSLDPDSPGGEPHEKLPGSPESQASWVSRDKDRSGIANGERFICYMCYETHNTVEDALVAPCECKGDTRYLHVQCLQKWYHSSVSSAQTQVIRTTGNGAPACKICGAAYKTTFRRPDGKKASLLEMESNGPYLSLVVVTRHDTNPGLFNTKFRLNFGRSPNNVTQTEEEANSIIIGRSSTCNMILDYRTVSTVHAKIHFQDGKFYLSDKRSSNGTMIYLQDPIHLPYTVPMKFRMGRTTLTLQAKKSWSSTMRGILGGSLTSENGQPFPSANDIFASLVEASNNMNKVDPSAAAAGGNLENDNSINLNRSMSVRTINEGGSVDGGNDLERINGDADNDGQENYIGPDSPALTHHNHHGHGHGHNHGSQYSRGSGRLSTSSAFHRSGNSSHSGHSAHSGIGPLPSDTARPHVGHNPASLATSTRDMDVDDEELQMAIQQSLLQLQGQQADEPRRPDSAGSGRVLRAISPALSPSGYTAALATEGEADGGGNLDSAASDRERGSGSSSRGRRPLSAPLNTSADGEEATHIFDAAKSGSRAGSAFSVRRSSISNGAAGAGTGNHGSSSIVDNGRDAGVGGGGDLLVGGPSPGHGHGHGSSSANSSIFADEFIMSLPAAGAFAMPSSAGTGAAAGSGGQGSGLASANGSQRDRDRETAAISQSRRNSPSVLRSEPSPSPARASTIYLSDTPSNLT